MKWCWAIVREDVCLTHVYSSSMLGFHGMLIKVRVNIDWCCFSSHWGRHKMAAVSQTTAWNVCSWMKMLEFRLRFHWSLFLRVQLTIIQHWFRKWLGAGQATSHYLNQWWLVYWRIYASLGLNKLTPTVCSRHGFRNIISIFFEISKFHIHRPHLRS